MREKVALLLAGAACALGGVAASGGMAGAQRATASSDAQIVRAVRAVEREARHTTDAVRSIRGSRFSGAPPTLIDIEGELKRITQATRAHCSLYHQTNDRISSPCG